MEGSCCRYPVPLPKAGSSPQVAEAYRRAAKGTVDQLGRRPGRPAAMAPFDRLMSDPDTLDQQLPNGAPLVGYLCNFVPDELVLAAGAVPRRLDLGLHEAAEASELGLPRDLCPEVRAVVGARIGGLSWHDVDLMVLPTACDGKKKLARILDGPTHLLHLPQAREGQRNQGFWRDEIREFSRRLEALDGCHRIRRGPLRRAMELVNRRTALARKLNHLRLSRPGRLWGSDALLVYAASFVAHPAWWVEQTAALIQELEQGDPGEDPPVRLLLLGSPVLFPDFSLPLLAERAGAALVADELCSATQRLYNPTVGDEWSRGGMIRAAADKTLLPCTCPCFVSGDDRIERVLSLCAEAEVDGVLHHGLRLCTLYDMELPALTAALRARDLPLLSLTAEFSPEGEAVIRNRVEAFVEMLDLDV